MKPRWFRQARFNFWLTLVLVAVLMLATNSAFTRSIHRGSCRRGAKPRSRNVQSAISEQHLWRRWSESNATANVLNIQPVLPFTVGEWNIISRTIAPLVYLPSLTTGPSEITQQSLFSGSHFCLGDINQSFIFRRPSRGFDLGDRAFLHSTDPDSHDPGIFQV